MEKVIINNEEYPINFTQGLMRDDLVYLNQKLMDSNNKMKLNLAVAAIGASAGAVICFIRAMIVWGIVFVVLAAASVVVLPLLLKLVVKSSITSKMSAFEMWNIRFAMNENTFYYSFVTEDLTKIDPYNIKDIQIVKENNLYFFIQMTPQNVLLIKKSELDKETLSAIRDIFERHLILGMRYIRKKSVKDL